MGNKQYNKLIRDKIPEIIKANGDIAVTHVADDKEYWKKLKEKLLEEVNEFIEAESPEEMADILEVIDAIVAHKKFNPADIDNIKMRKFEDRGGFSKKIILDETK